MDRASSLIFPGSRTLAGWWRQLQPFQPFTLYVGYAFVHRVEAPVHVLRRQAVDSFTQLILQAILLEQRSDAKPAQAIELDDLGRRLHLPPAVLQQMLLGMEKIGLLQRSSLASWQTTEYGREAQQTGHYLVHAQERRVFSFLEHLNGSGERIGPPRFCNLAESFALPWQVEEPLRFETSRLQACIAEAAEWKQLRGFPTDVQALLKDASLPAWQQVIVDRPERLLIALILTGKADAVEWLGFAVRADGWILTEAKPILRLPLAAAGQCLSCADLPTALMWQEAWRSWCRQRHLPANEVESCTLNYQPPRLEVQAPQRFVQRLRAAKSDLLKGEAWLLVGDGYLRTAALLTLRE